jgi:hypothetical protein
MVHRLTGVELIRLNFPSRANLTLVKMFRLWLLLLLAMLLPIRGAVAAGMLCPVGGFGVKVEAQLGKHAHSHDGAGHHHDDTGSSSHDQAGSTDKCNLCSAFCSVTGLVSSQVALAEAQPVPTVFPHIHPPPPSFFSDGQERPPRTI